VESMERKSIETVFPIDVYDRDMTTDIWLTLPYDIAWKKARPYDIAWKKTCHILGICANIPSMYLAKS
jgi:hypothetical protein